MVVAYLAASKTIGFDLSFVMMVVPRCATAFFIACYVGEAAERSGPRVS